MHLSAFALASTSHLGSRCCEAQAPQPGRTEGASMGGSSASASAALVASNSAATSSPRKSASYQLPLRQSAATCTHHIRAVTYTGPHRHEAALSAQGSGG